MTELFLELNIAEILLVSLLSFIGAFCNRYWKFIYNGEPLTFKTWVIIMMNVLVVTIISISIDPFLLDIEPRLMLLPPFLMSLVGDELIVRLTHISSSMELIQWFLKIFKRGEEYSSQSDSEEKQEHLIQAYQEVVTESVELTVQMERALTQYKVNKDIQIILDCYNELAPKVSSLKIRYDIELHSDYTLKKYIVKMKEVFYKLEAIRTKYLDE